MITDNLKNSSLYYRVNNRLKIALVYLQNTDFKNTKLGKHEIDSNNIYALVNCNETKVKGDSQWEAHRKYIDIHYVFEGSELMGYNNIDNINIISEYNDTDDCLFLEGEGDFFIIKEGHYVIFFPQDAHMPGLAVKKPDKVKKVIVKVRI